MLKSGEDIFPSFGGKIGEDSGSGTGFKIVLDVGIRTDRASYLQFSLVA
ncbi:MAG: hypothetical protein R3B93_05160 [Bacteroidia bacterium]